MLPNKNILSLTLMIPSFNQTNTIEQTLMGILDHNNSGSLEVLVFDSISTDETHIFLICGKII